MARLIAIAATLASLSIGCNAIGPETCARDIGSNPPVTYTEGKTNGTVYMTSAWDGELLYFPGGMHYELVHGLGAQPAWIDSYLSFERFGTREGGIVSHAAGNDVEIVGVTDQSITLDNGSCSEFWLLVVAGTGSTRPSPP